MAQKGRRLKKTDPEYPVLVARLTAARTPQPRRAECAVFGCRSTDRDPGLQFHPFPQEPERWSQWLQLINRRDLAEKLRARRCTARVCSLHFASCAPTTPSLHLPTTSHEFVYAVPPELSMLKTELVEIQFEPEAPPTFTYPDDPSLPDRPGPHDGLLGPHVDLPGPNVDLPGSNVDLPGPHVHILPTVDLASPNVDQLESNVNLSSPNVGRLRPNVSLPGSHVHIDILPTVDLAGPNDDQLESNVNLSSPNVDRLRPNVSLPGSHVHIDILPTVDLAGPNDDQLESNVNLSSPNVDRLRPNVSLPGSHVHIDILPTVDLAGPNDDQLESNVNLSSPNVDRLRPNVSLPGSHVHIDIPPTVDPTGPNVDQLESNVNLSSPNVDRLRRNVSLPTPDVDQLRLNANQPRPHIHRLNINTQTVDSPETEASLESQLNAESQTDSGEAFHRLGTFSAVELINIPPTAPPPSSQRAVGVQTGLELADHFTRGIKRKLEAELEDATNKLKIAGTSQMQKTQFLKGCDKYLDEKIANFIQSHAYLADKFEGNKYPSAFKTFALNLYLRNPTSYKFVERFFCLPSRKTIQKFVLPTRTGINENLMGFFKVKVDQMTLKGKMCVVCFDVIKLSRNLYYDVTNDYLCGNEEIDEVSGTEPAEYAAVFMVQGLYTRWKQPVSFALVSEKRKYPELKTWLHKTITALFDLGLTVKAFVRNLNDEFLDISLDESAPYFVVDGKKIYHIYDVPDILKNTRDQLMQHDFYIGDSVAKWEHVLNVYDLDKQQELKLMCDITENHVRPDLETRSNVKLATQVFSDSVAAAMHFHVLARFHPKETKDTIRFITKMSKLFDVLYSRTLSSAYRGSAAQQRFLKETIDYLREIEVRDKYGNNVENKVVPGLIITIKSIISLIADQKKCNVKYLLTKNLSKDCMQTYFEETKLLAKCERPTPIKFVRSFRRLFLVNLLKHTKVGATEDDMNVTLAKISEYVKDDIDKKCEAEPMKSLAVGVTDYKIQWPSNEYIAGYLLSKCLERHACPQMIEKLCYQCNIDVQENPDLLLRTFQSYSSENIHSVNLKKPPPQFTEFVDVMERKFDQYSRRMDRKNINFGWNVYSHMESDCFLLPCMCFPLKYMKMLYIRLKVFNSVKNYSRLDNKQAVGTR